jgi:hypothetical protein
MKDRRFLMSVLVPILNAPVIPGPMLNNDIGRPFLSHVFLFLTAWHLAVRNEGGKVFRRLRYGLH